MPSYVFPSSFFSQTPVLSSDTPLIYQAKGNKKILREMSPSLLLLFRSTFFLILIHAHRVREGERPGESFTHFQEQEEKGKEGRYSRSNTCLSFSFRPKIASSFNSFSFLNSFRQAMNEWMVYVLVNHANLCFFLTSFIRIAFPSLSSFSQEKIK